MTEEGNYEKQKTRWTKRKNRRKDETKEGNKQIQKRE